MAPFILPPSYFILPQRFPRFPVGNKRKSPNHRRANKLHASSFRTSLKKLEKGSAALLAHGFPPSSLILHPSAALPALPSFPTGKRTQNAPNSIAAPRCAAQDPKTSLPKIKKGKRR